MLKINKIRTGSVRHSDRKAELGVGIHEWDAVQSKQIRPENAEGLLFPEIRCVCDGVCDIFQKSNSLI